MSSVTLCEPNNNHGWTTQRIPTSSAARVCNTNSEFHGPLQAQHLRRGWTTQRIPTSSADNVCTTISRQPCNLTGRNLTTTRIPISSATCCRPGTIQLLWTTLAHRELHTLGNMVPWLLWHRTTTTNKTAPTNTVNGSSVDCTLYELCWCGCHGAVKTPKVNTAPTCCVNWNHGAVYVPQP